jgi:hypothetical protein
MAKYLGHVEITKHLDGLFVVETYDGKAYLGYLESQGVDLKVMTGRTGKPPVLAQDEVASIYPATAYKGIEVIA